MKDNTFSVENTQESTGFLLWQVTSLWQQKIKQMLSERYAITHTQFVIMTSIHWLSLHHKEVTQVSLTQHTKIDVMNISQVLKVLQTKNYISRKEHSTDTRAKAVSLTAIAKEFIPMAIADVEKIDQHFFAKLGDKAEMFNRYLLTLINDIKFI